MLGRRASRAKEKKLEIIDKIVAFLKLPMKFIVTVSIIMGLLLFLPKNTINTLQLNDFIQEYGKYIGFIFLISLAYVVLSLLILIYNKIRLVMAKKKFSSTIVEVLNNLAWPDRYLLREFYLQGKDVIEVPYENTEFTSLYNKSILQIASNNVRSFAFGRFVSVTINPLVKKYITSEMLGLPNGKPTEKEIEEIKSNRPIYLNGLNYVDSLLNRLNRF